MPRASKKTAALVLCAWWPACNAAAPIYFDLGGLVILVLGIILGLFFLIGRMKGVIAFFTLLGACWVWIQNDSSIKTARASTARETLSRACFSNAGTFGSPLPHKPNRVLVRVDSELRASSENRLWVYIQQLPNTSQVEFVDRLPSVLDPTFGYVEIEVIKQEIKGAEGWFLDGIRVTIKDGTGKTQATHVNYRRDFSWCLGKEPLQLIEQFLESRVGTAVRLTTSPTQYAKLAPVLSPVGTTTPVIKGRFAESTQSYVSDDSKMRQKLLSLPPSAGCRLEKTHDPDYFALCREGTPEENRIDLAELSVVFEFPSTWLAFSNGHSDGHFFDSLSVVERDFQGIVVGRWYVRLPPVESQGHSGFEIRNVSFVGRRFTANLVFSREIAFDTPATKPQSFREWYERQTTISANLISE